MFESNVGTRGHRVSFSPLLSTFAEVKQLDTEIKVRDPFEGFRVSSEEEAQDATAPPTKTPLRTSVSFVFANTFFPKMFGGVAWDVIQPLSFQNIGTHEAKVRFSTLLVMNLMCIYCHEHATLYQQKHPYKRNKDPDAYARWWWTLHNHANKNSGKPALTWETCDAKWRHCSASFWIPAIFEFLAMAASHQLSKATKFSIPSAPEQTLEFQTEHVDYLPLFKLVRFFANETFLPVTRSERVNEFQKLLKRSKLCDKETYLPLSDCSKFLHALAGVEAKWYRKFVNAAVPLRQPDEKQRFLALSVFPGKSIDL